ncbi:NADH-quinone oxidoreductase subunit NuoE [Prosthecomicrobium pneumaticum]|uniref:NADH-quinone oxidoreductase subunit E n=1 Tax=Prosthecomicrobium pneumaticum TaxID=81895 RepID=A0A7W9CTA3_9HYPH|nr:NADH-quinone oxidoreductase subunit NuoE [Prosthecomicrobium pneumaticum]MBB5751234.1 NADH-quinone oxidoreductase subunit E [Prosthecomicrobium pneumaticum]
MAVRRLAAEQPESFAFTPANLEWARQRIGLYPEGKQASAVIPILWRAQEQEGWVTEPAIRAVAEMLGMPYIRVLEVATFYTQFQLAPVGAKAHIQVCGTTPCLLRGADKLIEVCRHKIHHDPFHVTEDGALSWEEVECLGACVNAPMAMVGKDTYEDLTPESFAALIDGFAAGNPPAPGPQIDRHQSAPVGGARVLTDPGLFDGSMIGGGVGLAAARDAIAARQAAEEAARAEAAASAAPAEPAPPAAAPAPKSDRPAEAPAEPVVKKQGEADKEKVPDQVRQDVPASDPAVRPDRGVEQKPQG